MIHSPTSRNKAHTKRASHGLPQASPSFSSNPRSRRSRPLCSQTRKESSSRPKLRTVSPFVAQWRDPRICLCRYCSCHRQTAARCPPPKQLYSEPQPSPEHSTGSYTGSPYSYAARPSVHSYPESKPSRDTASSPRHGPPSQSTPAAAAASPAACSCSTGLPRSWPTSDVRASTTKHDLP